MTQDLREIPFHSIPSSSQDTLRPIPTSAGSQRRHLHVLDDQAKEQLRACSEQAASKGKGHGLGPLRARGVHGPVERGSAVGAINAAGVANFKEIWDDLEPGGAFDMVLANWPRSTTFLCAVSNSSSAEHREHNSRALGQTGANCLLGQAPSGALERALSSALEQAF